MPTPRLRTGGAKKEIAHLHRYSWLLVRTSRFPCVVESVCSDSLIWPFAVGSWCLDSVIWRLSVNFPFNINKAKITLKMINPFLCLSNNKSAVVLEGGRALPRVTLHTLLTCLMNFPVERLSSWIRYCAVGQRHQSRMFEPAILKNIPSVILFSSLQGTKQEKQRNIWRQLRLLGWKARSRNCSSLDAIKRINLFCCLLWWLFINSGSPMVPHIWLERHSTYPIPLKHINQDGLNLKEGAAPASTDICLSGSGRTVDSLKADEEHYRQTKH